ncbi:protein arginine methyltransferase NDUFAF7, mitochondrial [Brachionichthys hirsutus]|uniref:protein arginine methyltransferase NDUFAF7, mitochondrial n=1 Tax=Brachionichthys hirsutus TaxID=412623 RepID=UPI00360478A1
MMSSRLMLTCSRTRPYFGRLFHAAGRRAAPTRPVCSRPADPGSPRPSMLRHLTSKIKSTGPITVAEYMREVLTNPVAGYYVRNNMLGPEGDFITSPEISQMFGELVAVWVLSEWIGAGRPRRLHLVELGPGKGSLAGDVLRVFGQLQPVLGETSVSLHLVEVSPALSRLQAQNLTGSRSQEADSEDAAAYRRGKTAMGLPVSWYRRLDDVPTGFSIFIAHEFFDALPIHKFQRTHRGWREVMVDVDPEKPDQLRFVVAPSPTLASSTLLQADERRSHVEVCAEGGVIVQQLARRIEEDGGTALISDYGHDGSKTDTFRGFKGHQLHDVLSSPGSADLTADVDFSYLRRMAGRGVACLGPVTQRTFLKNMGIDTRLQVLLRSCSDASTRKQLIGGYDMLTNRTKMGECFHFLSLLHHSRLATPTKPGGLNLERKPSAPPVAGFTELSQSGLPVAADVV